MAKLELLAPAGNEAALRAAVQSGADAVYIGGPQFSARRGADNFSIEKIKECVKYCHLYGVDVHVAVNTLIKEKELDSLFEYVCLLNEAGVDALIIQDLGAAERIHRMLPDMALHASTQMTVTSLEGVRYLESLGFSRVVLARELTEKEIEYICANSRAEIEVFVHGAICMSYSGQCLMSSVLGGRSGNRGCCAQPCRLPYRIIENSKEVCGGYFLSPKDMCLIHDLNKLKNIGVTSLKIEGRLKRAEYVSAVVGVYRKYLDDFSEPVSHSDVKELTDAFSRSGFTNGYFTGKLGKNMMSHTTPGNVSDNKFTDEAKSRCADNAILRKIPVNIMATVCEGTRVEVTMYDGDDNYVTASSDIFPEKAINKPINEERIKEQLSKLGNTPFVVQDISVLLSEGVTVPVKELNLLRRMAVDKLTLARESRNIGRAVVINEEKQIIKRNNNCIITAQVNTLKQAMAAIDGGIKVIYAPSGIVDDIKKTGNDIEVIVNTSEIFDKENIKEDSVMVSSAAEIEYYREKKLYGDFRLNVFNSLTANHFGNLQSVTLSPELNIGEIKALIKNTHIDCEVIAYGHLPLMLMHNCPLKAAGKCQNKTLKYKLRDRKNEEFIIMCTNNCNALLLNSKPVYMADKIGDLTKIGINRLKLVFSIEDYDECRKTVDEYICALNGGMVNSPKENTFTRGHFYRGVL